MTANSYNLIDEIEKYSGNQLKRRDDLSVLIQLGYANNQKGVVEELSFTSKYVLGLFRVLKKASGIADVQNTAQIKIDLTKNLELVKEKLEQLIVNTDESTQKYFRHTYLDLSQNSMFNLTELMNDLEWTKKYLNRLKRNNPN